MQINQVNILHPNGYSKSNKKETFAGISGKGFSRGVREIMDNLDERELKLSMDYLKRLNEIDNLDKDYGFIANEKGKNARNERLSLLDKIREKIADMDIIKDEYSNIGLLLRQLLKIPAQPVYYKKNVGFDRVAGYNDMKYIFNTQFFNALEKKQKGENIEIPNAFIFFGPYGNGKTNFAHALAEQIEMQKLNCRFTTLLEDTLDGAEENLNTVIQSVKNIYNSDIKEGNQNRHHIFFIDEYTEKFGFDKPVLSRFSDYMKNIAKEKNATFFLTTNHVSQHGLNIENVNPVFVSVDFPDVYNMTQILKHHVKKRNPNLPEINYLKLSNKIMEFASLNGKKLTNRNLSDIINMATPPVNSNEKINADKIYECAVKMINNDETLISPKAIKKFEQEVRQFINCPSKNSQ